MLIHISYKNGNQETMLPIEEFHYGYDCLTITFSDGGKEEIKLSEISIFKIIKR